MYKINCNSNFNTYIAESIPESDFEPFNIFAQEPTPAPMSNESSPLPYFYEPTPDPSWFQDTAFPCCAVSSVCESLIQHDERLLHQSLAALEEETFSLSVLEDAFCRAAEIGCLSVVKKLLAKYPSLLRRETILREALLRATQGGWKATAGARFEVVKYLSYSEYLFVISEEYFIKSFSTMFASAVQKGDVDLLLSMLMSELAPYLSDRHLSVQREYAASMERGSIARLLEAYEENRHLEQPLGCTAEVVQAGSVSYLTGGVRQCTLSIPSTKALRQNLATARKIIDFLQKKIPFSANFIRRTPFWRNADATCAQTASIVLEEMLATSSYLGEKGVGNCGVLSRVGRQYAQEVLAKEDPDLQVDEAEIAGGDHVFLVIHRTPKNGVLNRGWGQNPVICDPWAGAYYPEEYIAEFLYDFIGYFNPQAELHTMVRRFNSQDQTIRIIPSTILPDSQLDSPPSCTPQSGAGRGSS